MADDRHFSFAIRLLARAGYENHNGSNYNNYRNDKEN